MDKRYEENDTKKIGMNYKIVFFDVDGTLINYEDGCISSSIKSAIRLLKDKGIRLVLATGRPLSMCQDLIDLGIDTFITVNGAYTKYQSRVIHKTPLPNHIVTYVKDFADKNKLILSFFTEELTMNRIQSPTTFQAMRETLSVLEYQGLHKEKFTEEIYLMCLYAGKEINQRYEMKFQI